MRYDKLLLNGLEVTHICGMKRKKKIIPIKKIFTPLCREVCFNGPGQHWEICRFVIPDD